MASGNAKRPAISAVKSELATAHAQDPKSICAICGDHASGKHYGVFSCEGCKGFFKRTVRKELKYECQDHQDCVIEKSNRNRCQFCRYNKCLKLGMRREAVQEERHKVAKAQQQQPVASSVVSTTTMDMAADVCHNLVISPEQLFDAEVAADAIDMDMVEFADVAAKDDAVLCDAVDRHLLMLVEWARHVPFFLSLPVTDQVVLLRSGWNELLIAVLAYQSTATDDCILLSRSLFVYRNNAHQLGIGTIFDRILAELVYKMREMKMDQTELGCLRATILLNPDAKGLSCSERIEELREEVYKALDEHCRRTYTNDSNRFAKVMLRLPSLRSIGLKCANPLFVSRLVGNMPIELFLHEILDYQLC